MSTITQNNRIVKPACCEMFLFHLVMKIGSLLEVFRGATNGKDNANLLRREGRLNRFHCWREIRIPGDDYRFIIRVCDRQPEQIDRNVYVSLLLLNGPEMSST